MANEQMVKVDLDSTVGQRLPGQSRATKLYGPGKGIEVPVSLARSLGLVGGNAAIAEAAESAEPRKGGRKSASGGEQEDQFSSMTKDDLVAEATRRELDVKRADGKDGEPLVEDYLRALREAGK